MKFDSVAPVGTGGSIVLTRFPGRADNDEFSAALAAEVFQALEARNCRTVVSLAEHREFESYGARPIFTKHVAEQNFTWHHAPVDDYQVPDDAFLSNWTELSRELIAELIAGRDICMHCKGGLGRSGTVAAILLIDQGESNERAIERIREARPGAIETSAQEAFVRAYQPTL